MSTPLYSVGTWDTSKQSFAPQPGLSVPSYNCTIRQLRTALKELRKMGYGAYRVRDSDGTHDCNDPMVLVERADGKHWKEIRKGWRRYL